MLWLILIAVVLLAVFGPAIWVRWVMQAHSEQIDGMPGTGGELAEHLLERFEVAGVGVEQTEVGDHYDPSARMVRLTPDNYSGKSLTAVAVAAHEVGHALQHHNGDANLARRTALVPLADKVARLSTGIIWAAPVVGLLTRHPVPFSTLVMVGIGGLVARMLVHLVTLPTEWDASFGKALPILEDGNYLHDGDLPHARKILKAAALTYVAASLASLLNLGRWLTVLRR